VWIKAPIPASRIKAMV